MRTLVTCMGECLIDFLPVPNGNAHDFRMHPAGAPLNIAVGIARLDQPAAFVCKVADDYFGRFLRDYIVAEGVDSRFLAIAPGRSTLAFVTMEDGHPSFNFYGEGAADALLTPADISAALFEETAIFHTGSFSLMRGTTPQAALVAVERLKGKALLSLDPNIRPTIIEDEASYRALLQHLFALVDMLKLSDADLAWLLPGKTNEEALVELSAYGPALVIVTCGAEGALALRSQGAPMRVPGFAVDVVDTVGAGDAFCAGLLARCAQLGIVRREALQELADEDVEALLLRASAAAALNCTRAGANPPRPAEIEAFLQARQR
ncbi:carbohydrate kinase [Ktedonosporobacter rubrisoli]|uniref:Carbohydrate kinase n=1 Tax=Ktedonosporobacter rubrisoli TaxID=2509675 RepID=A0A4P6JL80_KTERU|nr:carbohydrate kinase [Ktedonosporobacter rubrisoli]QBD75833.1 carbohydrate kinase [Ktedonosporobacter rubrisoli]